MADMEEKVFNLNSKLTHRLWGLFLKLINTLKTQAERFSKAFFSLDWVLGVSSWGSLSWAGGNSLIYLLHTTQPGVQMTWHIGRAVTEEKCFALEVLPC